MAAAAVAAAAAAATGVASRCRPGCASPAHLWRLGRPRLRMRLVGMLFILVGSLLMLFFLRLLRCPEDAPARPR